MAWTAGCTGDSHAELVANLVSRGFLRPGGTAEAALLATDRGRYCPAGPAPELQGKRSAKYRYGPYADAPQALGIAGMTISAPYIHATALSALAPRLDHLVEDGSRPARILDVGCGSGVLVACLARMAPPGSTVVGVDIVQDLVELSTTNLAKDGLVVLRGESALDREIPGVRVLHRDGWAGVEALGPWDAVHVGAGASRLPEALLLQLAPGGVLLVPVGAEQNNQRLLAVTKDVATGEIRERIVSEAPVRFLPLLEHGSRMGAKKGRQQQGHGALLQSNGGSTPCIDWDGRYSKGWAYGRSPSSFMVTSSSFIDPSSHTRVVSLGEGQGRNAVFLAEARTSVHVLALDASSVGLKKCRRLAKERGVADRVETCVADLKRYSPEFNSLDVVVSIFCTLEDRSSQRELHKRCAQALRPGGVVIIECFSPKHTRLREGQAAGAVVPGPSLPDQLISLDTLLMDDFDGFDICVGEEVQTMLLEGNFHRGLAYLTRFVGRKPVVNAVGPNFLSFDARVHAIFSAAGRTTGSLLLADGSEPDQLLARAPFLVQQSCLAADRSAWCRHCWACPLQCSCAAEHLQKSEACVDNKVTSEERNPGAARVHFVVCTHPSEFLRSTSSARVAIQQLGYQAELLVAGDGESERRLDTVICQAGMVGHRLCILYPTCPADPGDHAGIARDVSSFRGQPTDYASDSPYVVTVLVPDGSWKMSEALVRRIRRRGLALGVPMDRLPCVRLDPATVAQHRSPLIDALKPAKGLGRLSTLEAMSQFLCEFGLVDDALRLDRALVPLVDRVIRCLKGRDVESPRGVESSVIASWGDALQAVALCEDAITFRPGLRLCDVCGENLATSARMDGHLRGIKHAVQVAKRFLVEAQGVMPRPSAAAAKEVHLKYSSAIVANSIPEPPDEALAALQAGHTKPACLPNELRHTRKLTFDVVTSALYEAVAALLARTPESGTSGPVPSLDCYLSAFRVNPAVFESFNARQAVYNAVGGDESLCIAYEQLVMDVVVPHLRSELLALSDCDAAESDLWYQYPPTLRLQPGPCAIGGKEHCDAEYGHQASELNFWLPLTNTRASATTLVAETSPLQGDFGPLPAGTFGEIAAFYGVACRHYAPPNSSQAARVSLDFRIGFSAYGFDPHVQVERSLSAPKRHGWRCARR